MENLETFGQRLRHARRQLMVTQDVLAEVVKRHKNTISRFETGERHPSSVDVQKICEALGINAEWLINGVGPMQNGANPVRCLVNLQGDGQPHNIPIKAAKGEAVLLAELERERQDRREMMHNVLNLYKEKDELMNRVRELEVELTRLKSSYNGKT